MARAPLQFRKLPLWGVTDVSDEDIKAYGGLDRVGTDTELNEFKKKVITKEVVGEAPIQIKGSLSFVEQVPWIQNKTIRENIIFNLPFD